MTHDLHGRPPGSRAFRPWHDDWFCVRGRRVFDLVLSNHDSVKLYKLSPRQYVAALGCAH